MKELSVNQTLLTKDGRIIGNAIITGMVNTFIYVIASDYGNVVTMTYQEILQYFHIGNVANSGHKHYYNGTHSRLIIYKIIYEHSKMNGMSSRQANIEAVKKTNEVYYEQF